MFNDHVLLVNEAIVDLRERLTAAFEASLLAFRSKAERHSQETRQLGRDPRSTYRHCWTFTA